MADGTVRGGFDLRTEGAVRGLREIRDMGREADASMRVMGEHLDLLEQKLDRFGRKRVSATVELSGFDRVNAQLTELELRLDRLGRKSVSSRVSLGGGFGNMTGGFGGGQGAVAGGPGSPLFSSLGGMAGRLPWWAMAAPLVPQLAGAGLGLAGSAGSAGLGLGAIGIGAAGSLGLGAGLSMAIARPAVTELGNVVKAQTAYNAALAEFGRQSTQAISAKRKLDMALTAAPGAAGAARQVALARSDWRSATAPGRQAFYSGISGALYNLRGAIPSVAGDANMATGAVAAGGVQLSRYLTDPAALSQYRQLTASFTTEMPTMVSTVGNLVRVFGNLATAAIPFFHEADQWVNHWTTGLRVSSGDTTRVRVEMEKMVTSAKDWGRMLGAGGRTLKDLLSPGVASGDSMVVQFTHTLDRWDTWLNNNPGKVRQFMQDGERGFSRIATIVGHVVTDVWNIFRGLEPILKRAEQGAQFLSNLGGGSLLTGGGLLYGAYQGARGALGGGGPSAAGLAGAFVLGRPGLAMRGGGGTVVGADAAYTSALRTTGTESYLVPRAGFQTAMPAAAIGDQLPLFASLGAGYAYTRASSLGGARGRIAFEQAYPGGTYGMPVSTAGERVGLASRAGGALRGAAAGAARIILPLAAIQGVIAGLNAPGSTAHQINAGVSAVASTLTLGAVSPTSFQHVLHSAFGTDNAGASLSSSQGRALTQSIGSQASGVRTAADLRALQTRVQNVRLQYEMSPADAAKLTGFLHRSVAVAASNAGAFGSNTFETAFQHGLETPGHSPRWAVQTALSGITPMLRNLGPAGAKAFAGDTAKWAAQMEADNPQLRRPIDRLMGGITDQLNHLQGTVHGKMRDIRDSVFFFNGQILQGSSTTWQAISKSLTDPSQVALEKLTGIWGEINTQAVTALTQMGFTSGEAKQIVTMTAKGGSQAAGASAVVGIQQSLGTNQHLTSRHPKHERGGVIGGRGLLDTVPTPDGGFAAPGEAWIANRHTMNALSSATLAKYGKTAWEMIRDETRPHSAPMHATGGFSTSTMAGSVTGQASAPGLTGWVQRQHPELHPGIAQAVEAVLNRYPLSITSTTRGGHASGSYHYLGEAADIAGASGTMLAAAGWIGSSGLAGSLTEGIHNPNLSVKYGHGVPSSYWGASTWAQHANHIHMAVAGALNAHAATFGGGGGAMGGQSLSLHAPRSGLRGLPGVMGDRAAQMYAAGLQSKLNARLGAGATAGGISAAGFSGGGSATANQALGHRMMLAAGWGEGEWPSLLALWNQESGWNANAVNPSSGAYGIPQSLGHGHPYALGDAPGQIAWGLNYIRGRYGSPSAAEGHERGYGWYGRGGHPVWGGWHERGGSWITQGPTLFGAGEKGKHERVTVTPLGARGSGHTIIVKMEHVHLSAQPHQIERIGREVASKILAALEHGGDTSDADLMAGAA